MLKLYNSLTRKLEEFQPTKKNQVGLYTCGPTVYNYQHIGNLRSSIFADLLFRTLNYNGLKVKWVMNITDIDDKTIKNTTIEYGPQANVANLRTFTDRYLNAFKEDIKKINLSIKSVKFIRVLDVVDEIKHFIKSLIKKGYAYKTADGVYFNIEKYQQNFGDYGKLVGENFLKGQKLGVRVRVDEYDKENLSDFALWKAREEDDANIFWEDAELGRGRPGWHIECSVINYIAFKSSTTDIHTGGVDLIFPHHTNEIAQTQPIYKPFVNYWLHGEHLLVAGEKMAKSKGNVYVLDDLIKKLNINPLAFRYLILTSHYRSKLNFTWESLQAAQNALNNLYTEISAYEKPKIGCAEYEQNFLEAINNDLDTPKALAVVWDLIRSDYPGHAKLQSLLKFDKVLGLKLRETWKASQKIPATLKKLLTAREQARAAKDFQKSDDLRHQIESQGFIIEDLSHGYRLKKKF